MYKRKRSRIGRTTYGFTTVEYSGTSICNTLGSWQVYNVSKHAQHHTITVARAGPPAPALPSIDVPRGHHCSAPHG